jgi:hypothetical protein
MVKEVEVYTEELWDWVCKPEKSDLCTYTYTILGVEKIIIDNREYEVKKRFREKVFDILTEKCRLKNPLAEPWICDETTVNELMKFVKTK